jgi:hypothetical protein
VYIFVRQDLPLPQQLVQASHAAHESGLSNSHSGELNSIIIFGTNNKEELESLLDRFHPEIPCYPFYEPHKNIGLTAFATEPIPNSKRHFFKEFKLWNNISSQPNHRGN